MEESMRTHQEEESKRTGSISNSSQQIQQQPDFFDFNANSEISSLQDNSNSNQHPQIGSNVYPQIGNNPYPQIGDYGQTQLRFGMAPGQSEEDYLLECMSNVQISQQNNQPNANIINNNQPNNGNNNKPSQQSIDDLLNM
ncbi:UNKNOWN [Stylonychia lemnae]|uniref:Uncharacterized protein n=1 Tax=Stylonychia lemnae TaxID=5949 RepID=A0A078B6K0_STYLE|nr:UNKNOWN [Stylonychia lemnae]|eukprot:CDW88902.1 UNKNOWN [Stylonychia lemnae]